MGIVQTVFTSRSMLGIVQQRKEKNVGIENYMKTIKNAYLNTDSKFSCIDMQISKSGNRIVTYLVNNFGVLSLDIFDFKDGKIYREYEFILD